MIEYFKYIYDFKILLFLLGIYLIYKLGKLKHNLHLKIGCEGPPPLPFLGNLVDQYKFGIHEFDKMCFKKYGKIYPFYLGGIKLIVVADEELLKQIMVKDAKCFTDRVDLGVNGEATKRMVFNLKGKDWERVRSLITPTFTSGKLKKMSPLISDSVDLLNERIRRYPEDKAIDFKEFISALTLDILARTMFGMQVDSQTSPNNPFVIHGKTISNTTLFSPVVALLLLFPEMKAFIRRLFPKYEFFGGYETVMFFKGVIEKAISERRNSSEVYNDFLGNMLKAHKDIDENDPNKSELLDSKSLTNQEIKTQATVFLLAGYETTAMTMTFLTYFLAKNPIAQQEVYKEILDSIGSEKEITYDSLMNLPLLDAAINETLRICPPAARTDRVCTQDVTLVTSEGKSIFAKKGDAFTIPIYAIQTDPSRWPDPDVFDLHRFDPDNKNSAYSFMPFGLGPRNCLGMRFALLETKWALVNILRKYEIVPCAETMETVKFKKTFLTIPKEPILLKVKKR